MEIEMLDAPEVREEPATAITLSPETRAVIALNSSKTELDLRALATKHVAIVEIKDRAGREQAHGAAMELMRARTDIEKASKAARDDATKFSKAVIAEEKRLVAIVGTEEKRLKDLRDQWDAAEAAEKAERERIAAEKKLAIDNALTWILNHAIQAVGKSSADIDDLWLSLEKMEVTLETFADRAGEAEQCRLMTLEVLAGLHAAVTKQEEAAAQVEAERARLEQERKERAAAERDAEAKAKALRDAEQAKLDAQAAELARQREALEAQQAAVLAAQQAEAKRLEHQARELEREQWERQREADIAEGARIWREAGAEQETCPDSSITGKVVDENPDLDPAVPVAADLPVSMEPPHPMDPSDADVIFTAARAVSLEYGLTIGEAIHRLAAVESWTQMEGAAA